MVLGRQRGLPATYFLIPFKRTPGEKVPGRYPSRRATAYDLRDLPHSTEVLLKHGCEIGVHGIDSWHSVEKGCGELNRLAEVTKGSRVGNRVHWLLRNEDTFRVLEAAGYSYDSSVGYNETVGYRAGTTQLFRPLGVKSLLELPLHIQDGALFFPQRLDLSRAQAETRCQALIEHVKRFGGVLTLLWHDRSHGPERYWGDFYVTLLKRLKLEDCHFGTAAQIVAWFRKRRKVGFRQLETLGRTRMDLCYEGESIQPPLVVRIYNPGCRTINSHGGGATTPRFIDLPWNGESVTEFDLQGAPNASKTLPGIVQ